jgi:hypothetical protein
MTKQQPEEALKLPTFGQRKMASRVCVVDGKPHVRKFLCETLEEIGFILFAKPMTAQKFALTSLRRPVTIPE